jgi:hypothetical protein
MESLGRLPRLRLARLRKQCHPYVKAGTTLMESLGRLPRLRMSKLRKQCHPHVKAGTNLYGIFGKVAAPGSVDVSETVASMCENWN